MPGIRSTAGDWSIRPVKSSGPGARRAASEGPDFPPEFLTSDSSVADEFAAEPKAGRRDASAAVLDFSYDLKPGEAALLAIRHPSGALTFHVPAETARRSTAKTAATQV